MPMGFVDAPAVIKLTSAPKRSQPHQVASKIPDVRTGGRSVLTIRWSGVEWSGVVNESNVGYIRYKMMIHNRCDCMICDRLVKLLWHLALRNSSVDLIDYGLDTNDASNSGEGL